MRLFRTLLQEENLLTPILNYVFIMASLSSKEMFIHLLAFVLYSLSASLYFLERLLNHFERPVNDLTKFYRDTFTLGSL